MRKFLCYLVPLAFLFGCADDGGGSLVTTKVRLALDRATTLDPMRVDRATVPCEATSTSCTPENLAGRIFSGGAMWGQLGPGAFNVTMLGATDEVINNPSQGIGGTMNFSLIEATLLDGKYAAPPVGNEQKPVTRMEFMYDYIDATFTLAGTSTLDGKYTIRTIMVKEATASDVEGTMKLGDKLLRKADESAFKWCNAAGCDGQRAKVESGLIADAKVRDYQYPGQGNANYVPFVVPVKPEFKVSGDALNTAGSLWSVKYNMDGALHFSKTPDQFANLSDIVDAFELRYEPDQAHAGQWQSEISVDLQFVKGEATPPAISGNAIANCADACAYIAACYGFADQAFGKSEAECKSGCEGSDPTDRDTALDCVKRARCTPASLSECASGQGS